VAVLACSVAGVTIFKGEQAWALIFNTLWFNGLLVALALSSGLTFFPRIWGRTLNLVSVGMIIFHVSFLSILGGVVYNSLFHFKGVLRLTEGETLPNADPASYDTIETGRFFDFASLRGETTLVKMHREYKIEGQDKRAAYEIEVGEGGSKTRAVIYMTKNLDAGSVRYLVAKEGYSLGVVLEDAQGSELYAAMVPLQSQPKGAGAILYTTGSAVEPGSFPLPPPPAAAVLQLQVSYVPSDQQDRAGTVEFMAWPPVDPGAHQAAATPAGGAGVPAAMLRSGKVPVGGTLQVGRHQLVASEVRYWVGMTVRRDPGLLVILSSLWAGLAGMTMTFVGRIIQDGRRAKREPAAQSINPVASRGSP
jgi:hypothetical protein